MIVITSHTQEVALIGDLIATEAKRKGLAGLIVNGLVRDTSELIEIGVPIFCRGRYPIGPLKLSPELKGIGKIGLDLMIGDHLVRSGEWAFGDVDGVLFLGKSDLPAVFEVAERSFQREATLAEKIQSGTPLGDLLRIEAFLEKRAANPQADFNQHMAELGQAI